MLHAFLFPYQAVLLIFRPGLRRFVWWPLLINIALFAFGVWAAVTYFDAVLDMLLPPDSGWSFLRWLIWPIFAAAWSVLVFYGFTITANLIGAPFNGVLSAQAEHFFTGNPPPNQPTAGLAAIPGALAGEAGKLWYLISRALPILILFFIPGINLLALPLWLLLGCWFMVLEYADYPMANHGIEGAQQRSILKARRLDALAFGAGVMTMTMIPGLNFLAMPAAVVGATRLWLERVKPASDHPLA